MNPYALIFVAAGMTLFATAAAPATDAYMWPNTALGRLETFALIEELNGKLLASSSATAALENWCAVHHMATPARITARVARGAPRHASAMDRALLAVDSREPLRYRHVLLACGPHVFSQAENWYVPSRLTAAMNRRLGTTDIPFGSVVAPLKPSRRTLSVDRLWSPLPAEWETVGIHAAIERGGKLSIPQQLFRHRAVVFDALHRPIALVVETYERGVLDFAH